MVTVIKTVEEIDHAATGARLVAKRRKFHLTQRHVAGRMKISHTYVSELERGTRKWSADLVANYEKALKP